MAEDVVDIAAYFDRIGYKGAARPTLDTLQELHLLHPLAIPFENLDPLLGRPVSLDLPSLQAKLVEGRRGGYCYEHNILFMHVLQALGFEVSGLGARVLWNRPEGALTPRTHMLLRVDIDGDTWIADVGFGGVTLTAPLRLVDGVVQETPHERFRLDRVEGYWLLQVEIGEEWRSTFRFGLEENLLSDYEIASYFVSTHRQSHFVHTLMAARPTREGRYALSNNRLSFRGPEAFQRELASAEEVEQVLRDIFGIHVPPGLAQALEREKLL